jgi:tetratricopeptide (TPR) repeat protein
MASIALARRDGKRAFAILAPACTAYPNHARLMSNLGLAHMMLERQEEAAACLERAVALSPDDADIRLSFAQFLAAGGKLDRATREIETVLRHNPRHVGALARLGVVNMSKGAPAAAEAVWRRALTLDPRNADILYNLSVVCRLGARQEEAAVLAERAYLAAPIDIGKRLNFALCRAGIGDFDVAREECKQVLMVAPESQPATELFARLTLMRGAVPAGIETLSHYVRNHPKDVEAILALANGLRFVGRMSQALAFFDQALALSPEYVPGKRLRRELLLALGRFEEVWPRPSNALDDPPRRIAVPLGTSAIEALVFGRLLAKLHPDGVDVVPPADATVAALLRHISGVTTVAPKAESETVPLQNLPAHLGLERDKIAPIGRYLIPEPAQREHWQHVLSDLPRPLIGIGWDAFAPGARLAEIVAAVEGSGTLVSLAAGPERQQLAAFPDVFDAGARIHTVDDLIAMISCLDVVVATDGLPLHIAGALDLPGIGLIACGYPWYFAAGPDRSLWYPSLELSRQSAPGNWQNALEKASAHLRTLLATPQGVTLQ